MTVNKLFQNKFVAIINHSVNNGYLWKKDNEEPFTEEEFKNIKEKIEELIKKDLPIEGIEIFNEEALNYFKSINHNYSLVLIEANNEDIFKCTYKDKFITLYFRPLKFTIQSYEKSKEYGKKINLHCIGDWIKIP